MECIQIFKCLCDFQRLRILNLLNEGPLCVCHIEEILEADQVKISKQLRFLKERGVVVAERQAQWMVYRMTEPKNSIITENLRELKECGTEELSFAEDLRKRATILERVFRESPGCAPFVC